MTGQATALQAQPNPQAWMRDSWSRVTHGQAGNAPNAPVGQLPLRNTPNNAAGTADRNFDGALMAVRGGNVVFYPPGTNPNTVADLPPGGGGRVAIYTSGIQQSHEHQGVTMQAMSERLGMPVIGVRNTTDGLNAGGFAGDAQETHQMLSTNRTSRAPTEPAVATLAETVMAQLQAGNSVHLTAHSEGTVMTSAALHLVQGVLDGRIPSSYTDAQRTAMRERFNDSTVETFASPTSEYPQGPRYVHYINLNDYTPNELGPGDEISANEMARLGGANASVVMFREAGDGNPPGARGATRQHDIDNLYLSFRQSPDATPRGEVLRSNMAIEPLTTLGVSRPTAQALVREFGSLAPTGNAAARGNQQRFDPRRDYTQDPMQGMTSLLRALPPSAREPLVTTAFDSARRAPANQRQQAASQLLSAMDRVMREKPANQNPQVAFAQAAAASRDPQERRMLQDVARSLESQWPAAPRRP